MRADERFGGTVSSDIHQRRDDIPLWDHSATSWPLSLPGISFPPLPLTMIVIIDWMYVWAQGVNDFTLREPWATPRRLASFGHTLPFFIFIIGDELRPPQHESPLCPPMNVYLSLKICDHIPPFILVYRQSAAFSELVG